MNNFKKPILIIGAPRSGTSMFQKILRNHPDIWSLPSESDMIWDQVCHPKFNNWKSEYLTENAVTVKNKAQILSEFENYLCPSSFWKKVEMTDIIWSFNRIGLARKILKPIYKSLFPVIKKTIWRKTDKRILEKTVSNCFRLGFVNEVFPDAKIIYPLREGCNNVNSIINGWFHPKRFFTYDIPLPLNICGYNFNKWKFVLPPGWHEYINKSIEEICAFQWISCHRHMLAEIQKEKYKNRVLKIKLEDISANPQKWLKVIADFVELPYDDYFKSIKGNLPIVNSADNCISPDKWKNQNKQRIEKILPLIQPVMKELGYNE